MLEIIEPIETSNIENISNTHIDHCKFQRNTPTIYSKKKSIFIQIKEWTLETIRLIDTGSSNTILDEKLVPQQYGKLIPLEE